MRYIIIALLVLSTISIAYADRTEDLVNRYNELILQRQRINEEILRTEGALIELKRQADEKAKEVVEEPTE